MTNRISSIHEHPRVPKRTERIDPARFVEVHNREADNIKRIRVIPPKLGRKNDYGSIEVTYKILKLS